jgi:hypothetical protein
MNRTERFLAAYLLYLLILTGVRITCGATVGTVTVAVLCGLLVAWWWSRKEWK